MGGSFKEWFHCFCVVNFDLEIGQALELVYPNNVDLTEQEKTNISYLAFPDSNSGCMGDSKYHVKLRVSPPYKGHSRNENYYDKFNNSCLPIYRVNPDFYWGFVYFRQIKDDTQKRGYFQKSFVILTQLPFVNLFYDIVSLIAPEYFQHGSAIFEKIYNEIDNWPTLHSSENIFLRILEKQFQISIPKISDNRALANANMNQDNSITGISNLVVTPIFEIDIFKCIQNVIQHVHMLWELVMTGEPLLVIGNSPTDCASLVQALSNLILPLTYFPETRPYFTIHDTEFKEFTQSSNVPAIILGVTNPYFIKTLQHWPHRIKLQTNSTNTNTKLAKVKLMNSKMVDNVPAIYTQYKPFLTKDKEFIKQIMQGFKLKRPDAVQNALLKRHLLELTQSFIIPLERYMASLMPLQKNISPFKFAPTPLIFKQDDFLATLNSNGPQLTSSLKGDWVGLYKRFFRSPNFHGWYESRYKELQNKLQTIQIDILSKIDVSDWAEGKPEVEVVDLILKLKNELKTINYHSNYEELKYKINTQIEKIEKCIPNDLKLILNNDNT